MVLVGVIDGLGNRSPERLGVESHLANEGQATGVDWDNRTAKCLAVACNLIIPFAPPGIWASIQSCSCRQISTTST